MIKYMITTDKFMEVVSKAEQLGCKVVYDADKKISFNANMYITVPFLITLENTYALAHEIGHVMDYVNGDLDYDKWLNDWSYRVNAEMSAWVNAYKLLNELGVSLDHWQAHVDSKLRNYFILPEVI
ncbi:hypothetical protein [Niallia sp. FSL R7-0271]|uniref:hypothetical protein n=1 Tax=Niallia sp. FSL R7-0271 TaxID=2921678 RepID=UPI0030FBC5CC